MKFIFYCPLMKVSWNRATPPLAQVLSVIASHQDGKPEQMSETQVELSSFLHCCLAKNTLSRHSFNYQHCKCLADYHNIVLLISVLVSTLSKEERKLQITCFKEQRIMDCYKIRWQSILNMQWHKRCFKKNTLYVRNQNFFKKVVKTSILQGYWVGQVSKYKAWYRAFLK